MIAIPEVVATVAHTKRTVDAALVTERHIRVLPEYRHWRKSTLVFWMTLPMHRTVSHSE